MYNTIYNYAKERMLQMGKFKIPSIPSTTQKAIRFPNDIIERVERAIVGKNCTFTAFVIAAVKNALDEIETDSIQKPLYKKMFYKKDS